MAVAAHRIFIAAHRVFIAFHQVFTELPSQDIKRPSPRLFVKRRAAPSFTVTFPPVEGNAVFAMRGIGRFPPSLPGS
jgi:hypothetical protein